MVGVVTTPRLPVAGGDHNFNRADHQLQPVTTLPTTRHAPVLARRTSYFARSWYSPVLGLTFTLSPVPTNSGTCTVTPFSSFAGFVDAVFVAVFITGAVSTTSSTSEFGSLMPTGRPS